MTVFVLMEKYRDEDTNILRVCASKDAARRKFATLFPNAPAKADPTKEAVAIGDAEYWVAGYEVEE